jgi:hypothetical protein
LYVPWPGGKPCEGCVAHCAGEMIQGIRSAVSPWAAGYVSNKEVRCQNCRHFDFAESECELFESLNESMPKVFACDTKVESGGCCNGWCAIPDPEPLP